MEGGIMGLRDRAGRELQNPKKHQTTSPKTCGAFGIWDLGWESAGKRDALQTLSRGAKALERRGSVWSARSLLPLSVFRGCHRPFLQPRIRRGPFHVRT